MPHSETTHADGTVTSKFHPTDEELAIAAEDQRAEGESLEHAMDRFQGYTASGTYVFSDPPEVEA
jgi:hypothetical protein